MSVDVSRLDKVEDSVEVGTHDRLLQKRKSICFIPLQGPRCFIVTYKISAVMKVSKTSQGYYTARSEDSNKQRKVEHLRVK